MDFKYYDSISSIIKTVQNEEIKGIEKSVDLFKQAILKKKNIYVFGSSHAGILTQELYYRAGGLMIINPIFPKETMLDTSPITRTSKMERLEGYGEIIGKEANFAEGDLLLIHSVSGRNPQTIEVALEAKKHNTSVICITNLEYSKSVTSRHSSGKKLYEIADVVLDNHGDIGDASVYIDALGSKVTPTSSMISIYLAQEIITQSIIELTEEGFVDIPIFYSANLDGGDDLNRKLYEEYKDNIKYKMY